MAINTNTQKQTSKNRNAEETKSFMEKAYNQAEQELEKYLKKRAFLPDMDGTEMSYGMIGAKAGHRYMFTFNNSQVTAEFYEYDLKNLNDEAKKTIESVKKDGKFELLGMTTEATLSDNGKYLMVYTDNSGEELNKTRKSDVLKAFKEYKK